MPIFTPNFAKTAITCDGCGRDKKPLARHHLGREFLFVSILEKSKLGKTKWYKKFRKRYYEFRPYDVRCLCTDCHLDVHEFYDDVMWELNLEKDFKHIAEYSVNEVKSAIGRFRQAYFDWREFHRESKRYFKNKNWVRRSRGV